MYAYICVYACIFSYSFLFTCIVTYITIHESSSLAQMGIDSVQTQGDPPFGDVQEELMVDMAIQATAPVAPRSFHQRRLDAQAEITDVMRDRAHHQSVNNFVCAAWRTIQGTEDGDMSEPVPDRVILGLYTADADLGMEPISWDQRVSVNVFLRQAWRHMN